MGVDYYATLNINRDVCNNEIAQAYRKLAIKLHPDKIQKSRDGSLSMKDINRPPNDIDPAIAHEQFLRIAEAYDVLSDKSKRAMYDQFGEEGLKAGVPHSGKNGAWSSGYSYHGDAQKTFQQFFGTTNPFADFNDMNWRDESSSANGAPMSFGSTSNGRTERVKQPPVHHNLFLTLQEMYHGCTKKTIITRRVMNPDGHTSSDKDKTFSIKIRPGTVEGQQIIYKEEGDQGPTIIPADIIFDVKTTPHTIFTRNGDDLEFTATVPLVRALVGCSIEVPTLDNREISVPINSIIHPKFQKVVQNEGMPLYSNPCEKGNLIIKFEIEFPDKLLPEAKGMIKQAFSFE